MEKMIGSVRHCSRNSSPDSPFKLLPIPFTFSPFSLIISPQGIIRRKVLNRLQQIERERERMGAQPVHVLLVSFPGQGHINPFLRLAKRLASEGLFVTFSAPQHIGHMMQKARDNTTNLATPTPIGQGHLRFDFFSDDIDMDDPRFRDLDSWLAQLNKAGPQSVTDLIARQAEDGRPVSFIISNPFLPWVLDVATQSGIPCALHWVQSCAVFSAYYYFYHKKVKFPPSIGSDISVQLPGMPALSPAEIPSFLLEDCPYLCLTEVILAQFGNMSRALWVTMDSFLELERPIIESLEEEGIQPPLIPVGPLVKSIQGVDSSPVRGDMWKASSCLEWLDLRPPASVVYISCGSVVVLDKEQTAELAWGIRNSGRPFLWVVKPMEGHTEAEMLPDGFLEETAERGIVVQWCPQEQVLSHPSVACFVTHCGWNSSMESLCCGVPTVAFPQWGDQVTNAKCLADVYGTAVVLSKTGGSMVLKEEVERCIGEVIELKKAAMKWKEATAEAVAEGGSSYLNIQIVVDEIRRMSVKVGVAKINANGH